MLLAEIPPKSKRWHYGSFAKFAFLNKKLFIPQQLVGYG
jgi:hypothetical protein